MYKDFLQRVLSEVSDIANNQFGKVGHSVKPDDNNQVLTETDIMIGKTIVAAIQKEYPEHNVIDEESGAIDNGSDTTWVVDPIDGTSNFAAGLPAYGVMVGVLKNDEPVAGGVALPAYNEIYLAEKGSGTTCNGRPVHVTAVEDISRTLVAYGIDGHQEAPDITAQEMAILQKIVLSTRNLRTSNSAYDFMMTAKGAYGANLNQTSKIWDNVAPQIIMQEAGGIYTDFYGQPIDYSNALNRLSENFTVCTGSPAVHAQLQRLIHSI